MTSCVLNPPRAMKNLGPFKARLRLAACFCGRFYAPGDRGLEVSALRHWQRQRLTSQGAASPRGQQAPGDSAPGRLVSLL